MWQRRVWYLHRLRRCANVVVYILLAAVVLALLLAVLIGRQTLIVALCAFVLVLVGIASYELRKAKRRRTLEQARRADEEEREAERWRAFAAKKRLEDEWREAQRRREQEQQQALNAAQALDEPTRVLIANQSKVLAEVYRLAGGLAGKAVGLKCIADALDLTVGQTFLALKAEEDSKRVRISTESSLAPWPADVLERDISRQWFEKRVYITEKGKAEVAKRSHQRPQQAWTIRLGDHNIVMNSPIGVNTIEESYNDLERSELPAELREKLENLHESVGAMLNAPELTEDEKELAAEDLQALTQEVSRSSPRPAYWRRRTDGLLAVAKKVSDIGAPAIELVNAIITLLGGPSK